MHVCVCACPPPLPPQYPEWLEANKPSLSPEDYQRYEQQSQIMGEICKGFEVEEAGDKDAAFESIMDLMQKVGDASLSFHVLGYLVIKINVNNKINVCICIYIYIYIYTYFITLILLHVFFIMHLLDFITFILIYIY